MGFYLREKEGIKSLLDINNKEFFLKKSAYGFSEEFIFYNKEGEVIESISPDTSGEYDQVYFDEEKELVHIYGRVVETTFTFREFYKSNEEESEEDLEEDLE